MEKEYYGADNDSIGNFTREDDNQSVLNSNHGKSVYHEKSELESSDSLNRVSTNDSSYLKNPRRSERSPLLQSDIRSTICFQNVSSAIGQKS